MLLSIGRLEGDSHHQRVVIEGCGRHRRKYALCFVLRCKQKDIYEVYNKKYHTQMTCLEQAIDPFDLKMTG